MKLQITAFDCRSEQEGGQCRKVLAETEGPLRIGYSEEFGANIGLAKAPHTTFADTDAYGGWKKPEEDFGWYSSPQIELA